MNTSVSQSLQSIEDDLVEIRSFVTAGDFEAAHLLEDGVYRKILRILLGLEVYEEHWAAGVYRDLMEVIPYIKDTLALDDWEDFERWYA